jgi:hypothetical protein
MSLASLPNKLPFTLGGLVRPIEAKAYGLTGVLPKNLPFTLSAVVADQEIPYESVGWQLVCRSYVDFQTELLRTSDMTSLTFSKELSAFGAASFALNLDEVLAYQTLNDGSSIEALFDNENLWEIRFDNIIVFQMLGTAVVNSTVNEAEVKTATVSGSGLGKVLEWASVYPTGFPDKIVTKLETLVDEFTGETLDKTIWEGTVLSPHIISSSMGAVQEAVQDIETRTRDQETLTDARDNALDDFHDAKTDYAAVMKDKDSTKIQKETVQKQLNDATDRLKKAENDLARNTKRLAQANQRYTFFGPLKSDETYGHLKLILNNSGIETATSGSYDFDSSGISAGIEPGPSTSIDEGQITTTFKVAHDPGFFDVYPQQVISTRNYARMYTQRINNDLRLVAEISSNNEVQIHDWAYDVTLQKYWRIREDNGFIVMDVSADNSTWIQKFRAAYYWPSTRVIFQFSLELQGKVGIAPPLAAYLFHLNKSALPSTETVMQLFNKYLSTAQARGTITYVTPTYTNSADSRGLAWIGKPVVSVAEGTKLSALLTELTQIQQADWLMDVGFQLKVYQRTKEDETIPPVFFTKEDVVFHEAGSQINKERTRTRENIANALVGKNALGQYSYIEDSDSITKFQRREAFISAGNADTLTDLAQVLDSSLQDLKNEKSSWRITVAANLEGKRVFRDYDVGDWISIENIDSQGNITVAPWRVVGIAVNVASDATTTVELTLQSRLELLAARLKQQVDNLSVSSAAGGTVLGSAINIATLLEQATLAGLRDVVIPNPVEGDVLTYSNGFWVPVAPGDKTIPEIPEIVSAFTNVYYPSDGVSVRGQAEITWIIPTNTDGSFVTDGHHFEIRYRPDVSADYPATWLEAEQGDWDELYTWGQPTIPPITNSGWQTVYVGWDESSTVIQELTPGVNYEIQIRAVDSSTPQHFSEWSETYTVAVVHDTIAPPKPAPPVVASSLLSLQITHYLGRDDGGTFNLPPDMAYLEIHAGAGAFYPDDSSRIGKIIADQSMVRSGTPVIQTFHIDSTENVYVRVVAVDKAGNKSAPSNAVASTINLIDDAHISELTASKITAGTISSSIVLGGVIKTAETGARAEMNFEGFRIFSEDEDPTVSLLGSPGTNGNFLLIKDLEDPSITLAGIDGTGRGSFQDVTVNNDITIGGDLLLEEIINPRAKGVISIATYGGDSIIGGGTGVERGFLELSFIAEESRTYMICAVTEWESTVASDRMVLRLRDAGEANPTIAIPWLQQSISPGSGIGANIGAQIIYAGTFSAGLHRILLSFYGLAGNATVNPPGSSGSAENVTVMWVEDVGLPKTDTLVINDAGVDPFSAPTTPDTKPVPPKPKIEFTKTYSCTWSGTYRSNGEYSSSHGSEMIQGDSGYDTWLGDARSLCGFDYKKIMSDTKGASIKSCSITLYANHWYWNDGGTARIGTHNYTARPNSWAGSRVDEQRSSSNNWPKPGKRKVNLGTTVGNDFKSGAAKGIALGPTTGTKTQYGKFNGNGQSNEPVLTIVYVK